MSLFKAGRETRSAVSSFPAGAPLDPVSLLVLHWVLFPCWCSTGSWFPAGASQSVFLLVLYKFPTCHGNQTKWPLAIQHIKWKGIHKWSELQNMIHISSLVIQKMQFNHFPIIIKVKKDCLWKQRTLKITKIGDSVWLSFFICNTVVCEAIISLWDLSVAMATKPNGR